MSTEIMKSSKPEILASKNTINAKNHARRCGRSSCLRLVHHRTPWGNERPEHSPGDLPGSSFGLLNRCAAEECSAPCRNTCRQTILNNFRRCWLKQTTENPTIRDPKIFSTRQMKSPKLETLASNNDINAKNHAGRRPRNSCLRLLYHQIPWGTELPEQNPGGAPGSPVGPLNGPIARE